MVYINKNESTFDVKTVILTTSALVIIFLFGLYLQIKIIMISKKDKDMTWKIDISHSIIMIVHFGIQIVFETTTHVIPNLSLWTGPWFCYCVLFVRLYCVSAIISHSLVTSIHKYVFIIYREAINNFGIEKARLISLWITIFHPIVWAVSWMVRPHYRALSSINRCHGLALQESIKEGNVTVGRMAERVLFCGLGDYDANSSSGYYIYVANQVMCFGQTVLLFIVVGNIIELFFYKKIFKYMKRYVICRIYIVYKSTRKIQAFSVLSILLFNLLIFQCLGPIKKRVG